MELDYLRHLGFLLPLESFVLIRARQLYFLDLFAGPDSPLSTATRRAGIPTLPPIDSHPKVGGLTHDLTSDKIFDFFLRLAWTGCVALGAASPPCSAYSLLRLLPGGPRAIRSHANLYPPLDCTIAERQEWDTSRTLHERTVTLLYVVSLRVATTLARTHQARPLPANRLFYFLFRQDCRQSVFLPACKWFMEWAKSWLLATPYSGFRTLGGVCPHGIGAHPSLRGKRDRFGHLLSQQTARFPDALAADYATAALPLFSTRSDSEISLAEAILGKSVPSNTLQPKN